VIRRLSGLVELSAADMLLLDAVSARRERHPRGATLHRPGQAECTPRLLLAGWAARVRTLTDGRRQIVSLLVPGDLLGVIAGPTPFAAIETVALTPAVSAEASPLAEAVRERPERHPALARAAELSEAAEIARLADHVVRLGAMAAGERTLHWFLELYTRLREAGMAGDGRCRVPLTQDAMGDALGLSLVHVSRTLRRLRLEGLAVLQHNLLILPDPERAARACNFGGV
jgi:CRP-like cAMP-binding protein